MAPSSAPVVTDRPTTALEPAQLAAALGLGDALPVGQYRVDIRSGQWWWSDEVYRIHGLEPHSVVPSAELLAAHKHPDDRGRALREVRAAQRTGKPFSCMHRVVDAKGRTHTIALTGQGRRGPDGKLAEIAGYLIDVTAVQRAHVERDTARAVDSALDGRSVIDQAKGVIMATHGVDAETAANRLVGFASRANIRVRDVAEQLVGSLEGSPLGANAREDVETFLASLDASADNRHHNALLVRRRSA
ncbi:PAS and ANTAR domain-containing protein [Oerskovia flava]|uniref:PAS and ANTAR domain-containing protein n=1 Tax=Oerskovia flava TaxID=2986422 RepID=UPI0022400CCA|nr:PAS and ANTAR domain-containing protein [Oerskovia sp. JB1-3-2]